MQGIKVTVEQILGECAALPEPMKPGDKFFIYKGRIFTPQTGSGSVCICALQSLMPFLTLKDGNMKADTGTWAQSISYIKCADPRGQVLFKIEIANLSREELGKECG